MFSIVIDMNMNQPQANTCLGSCRISASMMKSTCIDWFSHGWYDQWNTIVHSLLTKVIMHVYRNGWDVPIGEVINCNREIGNHSDPCAVVVKRATLGASLI